MMKCRVSCKGEQVTVDTANLMQAISVAVGLFDEIGISVNDANSISVVRFNNEEGEE